MKFKSGLLIIGSLFLFFTLTTVLLYVTRLIEADEIVNVSLEGITFLSVFFFFILTVKLKAQKLLVLGCLFVSVASFFNILDGIEGVQVSEFVDVFLENGLFTIGILMCSFGVLFLLNQENEMNEKLKYQATRDSLTGLPNWYMLNEHLTASLTLSEEKNKKLAIMFLDLDGFKFVNDTKGHKAGDMVLKEVADRLVANVGEKDFVARKSGDEFLIILEDVDDSRVLETAERVLHSFHEPFLVREDEFFLSTSIGISLYPQDGHSSDILIHKADSAMYVAKKNGKNNFQFVIPDSEAALDRKMKLEMGLRKAINNDELLLYYQPQIELETGNLKGVEALLRWNHPELGPISPIEFIPIAEETGLIVPIGEWVIETACKQNRLWQDQGFSPLRIAVNVSALQFRSRTLVNMIKRTLEKHQLAPELLELEITESVMQDVKESFEIIGELKEVGVKVAIDDFGTGYSSLSVLHRFPIDYVKIDKSFVQEISTNPTSAALVKNMIGMGSIMNFKLIAEGIEDELQVQFLHNNGCYLGQGYFFNYPLPVEEFEVYMKKMRNTSFLN